MTQALGHYLVGVADAVYETDTSIEFDGTQSYDIDPDDVLTFRWRKGTRTISEESSFEYEFAKSGEYVIELTVTDKKSRTNSVTMDLVVEQGFVPDEFS